MKISVVRNVLDANERIAQENRKTVRRKKDIRYKPHERTGGRQDKPCRKKPSSPEDRYRIAVIEGDIQDTHDADRVAALGVPLSRSIRERHAISTAI
jgi:hydrogenase nickel incorporation protein HypB